MVGRVLAQLPDLRPDAAFEEMPVAFTPSAPVGAGTV